MQKITGILEARSAPYYFQDCDSGKLILCHKSIIEVELRAEVDDTHHSQILPALRQAMSNEDLTNVLRRHEIEGRVTKSQLSFLRDILFEVLLEQELIKVARKFECDQYRACILCPRGRDIVAREIYEYAMGAAG